MRARGRFRLFEPGRPEFIAIGALFSLLAGAWTWVLPERKGREITAAG